VDVARATPTSAPFLCPLAQIRHPGFGINHLVFAAMNVVELSASKNTRSPGAGLPRRCGWSSSGSSAPRVRRRSAGSCSRPVRGRLAVPRVLSRPWPSHPPIAGNSPRRRCTLAILIANVAALPNSPAVAKPLYAVRVGSGQGARRFPHQPPRPRCRVAQKPWLCPPAAPTETDARGH
jgi:hypothetical protein